LGKRLKGSGFDPFWRAAPCATSLACQEEIAERVGMPRKTVDDYEIAKRHAAELPAPSERPIPLERVGDVYSPALAGRLQQMGGGNEALGALACATHGHETGTPLWYAGGDGK
jgi:hypothetical protein